MKTSLRGWLEQQRAHGRVVWGYGTPAKGTVLLNYCDIGTDLLPGVVDSTPAKQGLYVPGTHQSIRSPDDVQRVQPDAVLILAWNHAAEIVAREAAYLERGGCMITPDLREWSPASLTRQTDGHRVRPHLAAAASLAALR